MVTAQIVYRLSFRDFVCAGSSGSNSNPADCRAWVTCPLKALSALMKGTPRDWRGWQRDNLEVDVFRHAPDDLVRTSQSSPTPEDPAEKVRPEPMPELRSRGQRVGPSQRGPIPGRRKCS